MNYATIIIIICIIIQVQADMSKEVILSQIEDGPLKSKILTPNRVGVKTDQEKSAEYILDVLLRSGSDEYDQKMTNIRGYWGDVFEMVGLATNKKKMTDVIDHLLVSESSEVKQREFNKISIAQQKIVKLWRNKKNQNLPSA